MFADLSLENRKGAEDVIEKSTKPAFKRELVTHLITAFGLSIPSGLPEPEPETGNGLSYRRIARDEPVITALQAAAERYPRYGFRNFQVLRRRGYMCGITRITVFIVC